MGRLPGGRVPRRRRSRDRQQERAADDPVLSRAGGGHPAGAAAALRRRRRDRDPGRRGTAAGLRGAAAAHPPGRVPDQPAGRPDAGSFRRLRPAGHRCREPHRAAVLGPARRIGTGPGRGGRLDPADPGHDRPVHRHRLVLPVRGGRAGRAGGQAAGRPLRRGQAGDVQDQARAHRGLRRGGLPDTQERAGRGRVAAARPLHRRGQPGQRGRGRGVPDGPAARADGRAAAAGDDLREPPVELGPAGRGQPYPAKGRDQPVERRQGPVLRPAAA